jgi:hypothetical protein
MVIVTRLIVPFSSSPIRALKGNVWERRKRARGRDMSEAKGLRSCRKKGWHELSKPQMLKYTARVCIKPEAEQAGKLDAMCGTNRAGAGAR